MSQHHCASSIGEYGAIMILVYFDYAPNTYDEGMHEEIDVEKITLLHSVDNIANNLNDETLGGIHKDCFEYLKAASE